MNMLERVDAVERRSLHDELADRLRGLITGGTLKPGEKVPEKELCERFGVSRTPLREALKVLASEGMVTLTPNRGASVSSLTMKDLEDVFPVMGALEALAGEIACQEITDREIARIRRIHEEMVEHYEDGDLGSYFRRNREIHEAILDATRNATLQTTYRTLSARIMTARYMANMTTERWAQAVAEHEDILVALEARDGPWLSRLLKEHLAHKLETVKDWLGTEAVDA
ncbi:MAG: GntR family transcriptional regulator [Hyphomicrobiales bacterium]|nr:GntR family transcriptional regulator [Hyphomicrobiales bacterium]